MSLIDMLKRHEGIRLKPYRDTEGKLTIGIGRNLDDVGINAIEAEFLLRNDIAHVKVEASVNFPWFKDLSQVRKDVILSMIFNLGLHGVLGFKKMIVAVSNADYELASKEMLDSKWAAQVGRRAYELSEMMRTDEYFRGEG